MWLVASGTYTQQRPHMGQHRNADTISTRQNLSLETEQPSPRNPALHAGLGMYVNITDDKFTSASPQHFQYYNWTRISTNLHQSVDEEKPIGAQQFTTA